MKDKLYFYKAIIYSVYDGDTCTARIDLGFEFEFKKLKLRLSGIDTPELRGDTLEAARLARDFLRGMVLDKNVIVETERDTKGKYGRYLATIWIENEDGSYSNVNDLLVSSGHGVYREY